MACSSAVSRIQQMVAFYSAVSRNVNASRTRSSLNARPSSSARRFCCGVSLRLSVRSIERMTAVLQRSDACVFDNTTKTVCLAAAPAAWQN
jgi:hypothetical protein